MSQHFIGLTGVLACYRARGDKVRLLVDLRGADEQQPSTRARMEEWLQRLCHPADRVSILVASSVRKGRMRQLPITACRELFISRSAAENWLLA